MILIGPPDRMGWPSFNHTTSAASSDIVQKNSAFSFSSTVIGVSSVRNSTGGAVKGIGGIHFNPLHEDRVQMTGQHYAKIFF